MRCKVRKQKPAEPGSAPDAEKFRKWHETSEQLAAAVNLIKEYPVPYPPELLPALIF